ncbi:hypothetical protein AVEN_146206-1 [Araneus ventricosus]|uniref:Uncharacterized protein n=1 Tax=Araneus ventricosus TaxID=182803 RepID=A0A4Y2CJI9_ARAVE|nr:hypothetical protein AVEN_146206-1 [Araneus ventricosus]
MVVLLEVTTSTRVKSRRISKRSLASLVRTPMVWACPLTVIVLVSFRRDRIVVGNGYYDSGISTRNIAEAVTQINRTENAPDRVIQYR